MIQGPLTLNWASRRFGLWPRVENGDFSPMVVDLEERVRQWVDQDIHVIGRPEWRFVKIHTHGMATDVSRYMFEAGAFRHLCQILAGKYNDGNNYRLHYVSARECFKAAEAGHTGNAGMYRDFAISAPPNASRH
jgi:hypothetical protein